MREAKEILKDILEAIAQIEKYALFKNSLGSNRRNEKYFSSLIFCNKS